MIGLYDIFRILASSIWKRIGFYLGVSFSLNLSFILIAITNFLFCLWQDLYIFIFVRILVGLSNGLSTFTKNFIMENIEHKRHKSLLNYSNFIQNFCIVFCLLFSYLPGIYSFEGNFLLFEFNKYFYISSTVSCLNLLTFLLCLVRFKKRILIPKRRTLFKEQIDLNVDFSRRKESVEESPNNNSNVIKIRFDSNLASPEKIPNYNYSSNLNKIDVSEYNSKDSAVETEFNDKIEEKSKDVKDQGVEKKYFPIKDEIELKDKIPDEKQNHDEESNKNESDMKNKSDLRATKEISVRNTMIKILNESNSHNQSYTMTSKITDIDKWDNFKISFIFSSLQICDAILYVLLLFELYGLNNLNIEKNRPNNSNKISKSPNTTANIQSIQSISLSLSIYHLIFAIFFPIINSFILKKFFDSVKSLNKIFIYFTIISGLITCLIFTLNIFRHLQILVIANEYENLYLICSILIRNICLTAVLTSYNLLIYNIKEPSVKEKIQSFLYYLSYLLRGLFIIISFYIYSLMNDFIILILLCCIPMGLLWMNICFLRTLNKVIKS